MGTKAADFRKLVKAIEASGAKFFETATSEEAKSDLRRDGSHVHPFVNLASVDERHVSIRLEKKTSAHKAEDSEPGVRLGRVSAVDKAIMVVLEKGPMSAGAVLRAVAGHESKYVRMRLKLMFKRGLIEMTETRYCLRGASGPKALFDGGSRYTEAPCAVPEKGIFKGDMLELSAAPLKEGDLAMASREVPSRKQETLAKVLKVWPAFVVLEGGEMRMKIDLFKVTSVFRQFNPAPAIEEARLS